MRVGVDILIETEKVKGRTIYVATSPDVKVYAEGKTRDEAIANFKEALKFHFQSFPEEKKSLAKKELYAMPMLARIFL